MDNWDDKIINIERCLNTTLLPPAINLYNYFKDDEINNLHYFELLKLIFIGAIKYSRDNIGEESKTIEILKLKMKESNLPEELFDISGFVE